ncbi:MAG: hypothetical protein ACR2OB_00795 [Solirubrobacteraceae bacterium]
MHLMLSHQSPVAERDAAARPSGYMNSSLLDPSRIQAVADRLPSRFVNNTLWE